MVIPCYNGERFVARCLESLSNQTLPAEEILIVDDGSTDRTVDVAKRYPVRIVRHGRNMGRAHAVNTGVKAARYEIVSFLDADCEAERHYLEYTMEDFEDDISCVGVSGQEIPANTRGIANRFRAARRLAWGDGKVINPEFIGGCSSFRKSVLLKVGLYDTMFRYGEDLDMSLRLMKLGLRLTYDPRIKFYHNRSDNVSSILGLVYNATYYGHFAKLKNAVAPEREGTITASMALTWLRKYVSRFRSEGLARLPLFPLTVPVQTLAILKARKDWAKTMAIAGRRSRS